MADMARELREQGFIRPEQESAVAKVLANTLRPLHGKAAALEEDAQVKALRAARKLVADHEWEWTVTYECEKCGHEGGENRCSDCGNTREEGHHQVCDVPKVLAAIDTALQFEPAPGGDSTPSHEKVDDDARTR